MSSRSPTAERYRNNSVRNLAAIARDLQSRMTSELVDQQGFACLRPSLGLFLSLIWTTGRPITLLAEQLDITKQACSQLANLAEKAGYLERTPDPVDRRSKLVSLSPHGRLLVERSIEVIRQTDQEYAAIVGPEAYEHFTAAIAGIYKGLKVPKKAETAFLETASRTVGALPLIAAKAQHDLMQATAARGHAGLKMSHSQVLPFVGSGGVRMSDLVRIQGIGRQAISTTSRDLEKLGYLRRESDPLDGRGVVLYLTDRGNHLIRDSVVALKELERTISGILGRRSLDRFLRIAQEIHDALETGQEIPDHRAASVVPGRTERQSQSARSKQDMERLASDLRRELGVRNSKRLATLLEEGAAEAAPRNNEPHQGSTP